MPTRRLVPGSLRTTHSRVYNFNLWPSWRGDYNSKFLHTKPILLQSSQKFIVVIKILPNFPSLFRLSPAASTFGSGCLSRNYENMCNCQFFCEKIITQHRSLVAGVLLFCLRCFLYIPQFSTFTVIFINSAAEMKKRNVIPRLANLRRVHRKSMIGGGERSLLWKIFEIKFSWFSTSQEFSINTAYSTSCSKKAKGNISMLVKGFLILPKRSPMLEL